jgi:hypothetical protein
MTRKGKEEEKKKKEKKKEKEKKIVTFMKNLRNSS